MNTESVRKHVVEEVSFSQPFLHERSPPVERNDLFAMSLHFNPNPI